MREREMSTQSIPIEPDSGGNMITHRKDTTSMCIERKQSALSLLVALSDCF